MSSYAAGVVKDIPADVEHSSTICPAVDRQAAARRYKRSPVRRVARCIGEGPVARYYYFNLLSRIERRQARNSPGSAP